MAESEFKIKVGVEIDDSSIKAQIDGIKPKPIKIPIEVDTGKFKKINKEIKNISNVGEVKLDADVSGMLKKVNKVTKTTKDGVVFKVKTEGINELGQLTTVVEKFKKGVSTGIDVKVSSEDIIKTKSDAQQLIEELKTIDSIKIKVDSGDVGNQVSKIESDFKKIINASDDAQKAMDEFTLAQKRLLDTRANGNNEELIKSAEEYELALKRIKNQIDINARSQKDAASAAKDAASAAKLQQRAEKLSQKMSLWLHDNSAAAEDFGVQIKALIAQLETCDNSVKFDNISSQFDKITTKAKLAGKTGLSFGDRLKQQFTKYSSYFSAASVVMAGIQATRAMFQNVLEVDTAMTELKRVTDLSVSQYSNLYDGLTASAQKYGVALTDLISATADWSRAGFDAETASGLAEATAVYQHIADLDYDTASENQLTAFKGFEQQLMNDFQGNAEDAVWYITDVFNELDNKYSVTAAGIGEALKRSASSLQVAGNTMQESAAMVTGITEVTQDPEKAGNALKVVSMRLRGMKGELQELGEETDESVANLSKMQGDILNLTKGKVNIFDDAGEFKSTYEILQGIADVWKELSSIEQADLLETIAGKHRANDVSALLNNWQNVEKAFISATEAEGSAMEEQAKYAESLQGRLNSLQAMWQEFSNTFLNSNLAKGAISGLTELLSLIEKIIDTIGGIGTTGIIGTLIMGFRHKAGVKALFSDLTSLVSGGIKSFGDLKAAASLAGKSIFKSFLRSPAALLTGIGAITTALSIGLQVWDNYQAGIREARQESIDASNSFSDAFGSFEQAYIKYSDKSILTAEEEGELATAINGTINALGDKSAALKDAVGAQSEYASNLDSIMKAELEQAQTLANEGKKAAKESLTDFWDKDSAGGYQWFSWKDAKADFIVPTNVDKEWKYVKDIVDDPDFKKYINSSKHGKDLLGDGRSYFRFDKDTGLDGYIEQLNYATEIRDRLSKAASETGDDSYLDSDFYKTVSESIDSMSSGIDEYVNQTYAAEKATYQLKNGIPKTIDEFYDMQDAVLSASASTVEGRAAILDVMSSEYGGIFDLSSAEAQIKQIQALTNGIDSIDENKTKTFETFIDMKTKVNSGEVTVGEYTDAMDAANRAIDKIAETDLSAANALRVQLGIKIDADGKVDDEITKLKDKFVNALTDVDVPTDVAEEFVDGLNAQELEAAVDLVASGEIDLKDLDTKNLDASLKKKIEDHSKYLEAMRFTIDVEAETAGIETFNSALAESRSATGLTIESFEALKNRYKGLASYDAATLFEETANGISLNAEAVNEYEQALANTKLDETNKNLDVLKDRYDELTNKIVDCTDATQKSKLINEREEIRQQITDIAELATAYEGLTSSYAEWQRSESSGNDRDLYSNVYSAMEGISKELKNGWIDDGTKEYFQLIWGEDKWDGAGKSIQDYRDKWATLDDTIQGTSYSIQDFFKTNKDGELTSEGIFNFFDAVDQVEDKIGRDVIKKDDNGNIVSFDFGVDGDKAIADALGISEELVQIFLRASRDAGFVVNFDGTYTQLANLQNEAMAAQDKYNEIFDKEYSFNFNTQSLKEAQADLKEAKELLNDDKFWNHDANGKKTTFNYDAKGAKEAMQMVSTLQAMVDNLDNSYIGITVEDKQFEEPLEKAQDYEAKVAELNQLKLDPEVNASDIESLEEDISGIIDYFAQLDDETKKELKIPVDLEGEALDNKIKEMLDNGSLEIPTTLDIQTNMNESIEDLRDLALLNSGILSEDQAAEIEAKFKVKLENEDIEKQVNEVLENVGIKDKKEIEIGTKFFADTQDIDEYEKPEEIKRVVKFVKDIDDIENYTPEDKQAIAKFVKDVKDIENYTPEQKQAIVEFIRNATDIEKYTPEQKQAIVNYAVNGGEADSYQPKDRSAIVNFFANSADPDNYTPEQKQAFVEFIKQSAEVDGWTPEHKDALVKFGVEKSQVDAWAAKSKDETATVIYKPDTSALPKWFAPIQRTVNYVASGVTNAISSIFGGGSVDGTAHVNGTAYANGSTGRAFKKGSWDTKDSGTALMGELGQETIVRDGRFFTVGDNGAEFVKYRKGDIIFNHKFCLWCYLVISNLKSI